MSEPENKIGYYTIEIEFTDESDMQRAYEAIEKTLDELKSAGHISHHTWTGLE